jgi:hypothetical protein
MNPGFSLPFNPDYSWPVGERKASMRNKNPHIGSSFESWLDEIGIREEVTAAAIEAVARQLTNKVKRKKR